jgi:N-acetylmuramoyl-L-alanine amidase
LHHTASPSGFAARIRAIQEFHMDVRGWSDIAYSFLINHEGDIYQGRGPGVAGGHTAGQNTVSHAICLLGNFDQVQPTQAALDATVELARHGFERGWWSQTFTGGHRDAPGANTSCPGATLYALLPDINQQVEEDMPLSDDDVQRVATAAGGAAAAAVYAAKFGVPEPDGTQSQASLKFDRTYRNTQTIIARLGGLETLDADELQSIADAVADELAERLGG